MRRSLGIWVPVRPLGLAPLLFVLAAFGADALPAQERGATVAGRVVAAETGEPLEGVLVRVDDSRLAALTDSTGAYRIPNVPPGPRTLRAERIGFASAEVTLSVPVSGVVSREIRLAERALEMEDIEVTVNPARRAGGELGTASVIDREAIEHVTATSLSEVLEMVPGVEASSPGLTGVQQVSLRSVSTTGLLASRAGVSASELASFGTLIVVDGVPLSNNANLQSLGPRGELSLSTSAGGGLDLRRFPAATIERVEVIRGIPSARWGELTNGAVIVETRAGAVEPELLGRLDARTAEVSLLGGESFAGGNQTASVTADYTRTLSRPGLTDDMAERVATQFAHRVEGELQGAGPGAEPRWVLDTRVDLFQLTDDQPENPVIRPDRAFRSQNRGLRISERARLRLDGDTELSFTGAWGGQWRDAFSTAPKVRPAMPFTDRLTEGRQEGFYVVGPYQAEVTVDGRQTDLFGRLELEDERSILGLDHQLRAGLHFRREGNAGPGRQFDIRRPPQVNFNGVQGYDRPRSHEEVPALSTSAFYVDDRLTVPVGDAVLQAQGGLRVDLLHEGGSWFSGVRDAAIQPRLNLEVQPTDWLRLRAGAGRFAKSPTKASLFPAPQYYDVVNVNWFTDDPAERLAVLTTFIEDPSNPELGFSTAEKLEAGLELSPGDAWISLAAYRDEIDGGVGIRREPTHLLRHRFALTDSTVGNGEKPEIITPPAGADTVPVLVDRPSNLVRQTTRGLELVASLPEIESLGTRLQVTGSWSRTEQAVDVPLFGPRGDFGDFQLRADDRRHPYWQGARSVGERAMFTYRVIHHQPAAGLVVTASIQHNVHDEIRDASSSDTLAFEGYMTRSGELVPVPREERGRPEFADLRTPRGGLLDRPISTPADWMASVQVSKSLPLEGRLNFWAFNLLDRTGVIGAGGVLPRPYSDMRFGVELSLRPGAVLGGRGSP